MTTTAASAPSDLLVIGGGPAGLATAIELAPRGRRVVVVDRGQDPGLATLLLSPRALVAARRLGFDPLERFHAISRLRISTVDRDSGAVSSISTSWPRHRGVPEVGVAAPRSELVAELGALAAALGVERLGRHDAVEPLIERGFLRGARVQGTDGRDAEPHEVRATFTVVADGAASRFGRLLGTFRNPDWPSAHAHAAEFASPLGSSAEAEFVVDLNDLAGTPIAGFGWLFPNGRGTVSVGMMLMSTSPSYQVINPVQLHQQFVDLHRGRWQLGAQTTPGAGGRVPLGTSVGPLAGPTYLIIGDAAAAANPLTGFGVDTALETGILAGDVVADALDEGNGTALQRYPQLVRDRYGSYYKVGRLADRLLGHPAIAHPLYSAMSTRRSFADGALRISTQHLRGVRGGGPEMAYRLVRAASAFIPEA